MKERKKERNKDGESVKEERNKDGKSVKERKKQRWRKKDLQQNFDTIDTICWRKDKYFLSLIHNNLSFYTVRNIL